ncbi:helix-turn-helix domain-containing protein [Georgenia muralis]
MPTSASVLWYRSRTPEALGVAVAGMRETRGLTQSDLARKAGTSRPTISRLERGKAISDETVLNIVASMGYELIVVPRGYMVRVESIEH